MHGVLYWDGRNHRRAILRNVSSLDQIKVGDTLVTHHSLIFPPDYPVGTVSKIRKEVEDGFYTLEVRLSNHFDRMTQVWIVQNNYNYNSKDSPHYIQKGGTQSYMQQEQQKVKIKMIFSARTSKGLKI